MMVESEILKLNKEAMERLRNDEKSAALSLLNSAQELLHSVSTDSQVWGITFNNLGCYFKKTEDYSTSLVYFQKALEILEKKPFDVLSISGTLLNLSSVYSEMKNHEKALKSAIKAHKILSNTSEKSENIWTSLVISYHSIAVEYENLGRRGESVDSFKSGWELAKERLGKNHKLTICMKKSAIFSCQSKDSANSEKPSKPRVLQFRSNSSNANSRVKFPKVNRRLITPTKENYKNLKVVERPALKTVNVHDKQVYALNSLVKEIEKTLEFRPKKYVFRKKADTGEIAELEHLMQDGKYLPGIKKLNSGFNLTGDSPASRNLHIIPEMVNEGEPDIKYYTKYKNLKKNLDETKV
jgi:tetratricopeptide (TPR) repeat protein